MSERELYPAARIVEAEDGDDYPLPFARHVDWLTSVHRRQLADADAPDRALIEVDKGVGIVEPGDCRLYLIANGVAKLERWEWMGEGPLARQCDASCPLVVADDLGLGGLSQFGEVLGSDDSCVIEL